MSDYTIIEKILGVEGNICKYCKVDYESYGHKAECVVRKVRPFHLMNWATEGTQEADKKINKRRIFPRLPHTEHRRRPKRQKKNYKGRYQEIKYCRICQDTKIHNRRNGRWQCQTCL